MSGVLKEIEGVYHDCVGAVASVMDEHQWLPAVGRCGCGQPVMDWWMWRGHAAPFIALATIGSMSGEAITDACSKPSATIE